MTTWLHSMQASLHLCPVKLLVALHEHVPLGLLCTAAGPVWDRAQVLGRTLKEAGQHIAGKAGVKGCFIVQHMHKACRKAKFHVQVGEVGGDAALQALKGTQPLSSHVWSAWQVCS